MHEHDETAGDTGLSETPNKGGLAFERTFSRVDVDPFDKGRVGTAQGADRQRTGRRGLRADRHRGPEGLVAARHEHRGQHVRPRPPRHARAGEEHAAAERSRRRHDHRLDVEGWLLPAPPRGPRRLQRGAQRRCCSTSAALQQPRSGSNRRFEEASQCSACCRRHHGVEPDARRHRGDALRVRLRYQVRRVAGVVVRRNEQERRRRAARQTGRHSRLAPAVAKPVGSTPGGVGPPSPAPRRQTVQPRPVGKASRLVLLPPVGRLTPRCCTGQHGTGAADRAEGAVAAGHSSRAGQLRDAQARQGQATAGCAPALPAALHAHLRVAVRLGRRGSIDHRREIICLRSRRAGSA